MNIYIIFFLVLRSPVFPGLGFFISRFLDFLVSWINGSWFPGFLVSWLPCYLFLFPGFQVYRDSRFPIFVSSGFLVSSFPGILVFRSLGFIVSCFSSLLVSWPPDFLTSWFPVFLIPWSLDFLVSLFPGLHSFIFFLCFLDS